MNDADAGKPTFDRAALLLGMPARRVTTLAFAIEARTARRVVASRTALATFQTERTSAEQEAAFLRALGGARGLPVRISAQDLERYAAAWAELVPPDPELRASLLRRLGEKYVLPHGRVSRTRAALGVDDAEVVAAYARMWRAPVSDSFRPASSVAERLRWWRAALAERLETLPPVWMAFALALTETIAEGVLAIPVAVAGVGPVGGIALLVALGLVNVVTIAALVEAITRTGRMRYGDTYFGRFVREYLGLGAASVFSGTLFVFNFVVTLVYFLGFGSVLADATGLGAAWWIGLLFLVNVAFVRRGSIDATVASALIIGAINIALIFGICAMGLLHLDLANFATGTVEAGDGGGFVLRAGLLQLVFGVIVVAYFGHTSAANAAKLILREDMTGRALMVGNVAAMFTVIGLYVLSVLAINGAVGAESLQHTTGTALTPLAAVAGPGVLILGSVYVVLALGIGSIYGSLGLFNQVREWLPMSAGTGTTLLDRLHHLAIKPRGRTILSLLPILALFVLLEALVIVGAENFSEPLGGIGVLAVPLMGGVFPMLLLMAARRRGDLVAPYALRFIGHPVVVTLWTGLFILAVALHGLVIWEEPGQRVLALVVTAVLVVIAVRAPIAAHFRPRAVVEVRAFGTPVSAQVSLVIAGARSGALAVRSAGRIVPLTHDGPVDLGRARELHDLAIDLPPGSARDVRVWCHQVDESGESAPWPAAATVVTASGTVSLATDGHGIADISVPDEPREIRIAFDPAGSG